MTEEETSKHSPKHNPKELSSEQRAQVSTTEQSLFHLATGNQEQLENAFQTAHMLVQARHWGQAARIFRRLAFGLPDTKLGLTSAAFYLDSLNALGGHFDRTTCYDDIARDIPLLVDLYCKKNPGKIDRQSCETLASVLVDIDRLEAEKTIKQADLGDSDLYAKGARQYRDLYRRVCESPFGFHGLHYARCDEIIYNAARAFRAARQLQEAREILSVMLEREPTSPLTLRLQCDFLEEEQSRRECLDRMYSRPSVQHPNPPKRR